MSWSEKRICDIEENEVFFCDGKYYECVQKGRNNLLVAFLNKYINHANEEYLIIDGEMYRREGLTDDEGFEYFPTFNIEKNSEISVPCLLKEHVNWK